MKRVIKRAVSFVLVFMTVFSVFTILPSEVFHTAVAFRTNRKNFSH